MAHAQLHAATVSSLQPAARVRVMAVDSHEVQLTDERRAAALATLAAWESDGDERLRRAAHVLRSTIERHPKPFAQRCRWCDHVYPCPDLLDVLDTLTPQR